MSPVLTVSSPISAVLDEGKEIHGTFWSEDREGGFFAVEHNGARWRDGIPYRDKAAVRGPAEELLKAMAKDQAVHGSWAAETGAPHNPGSP